MKMQTIRLSFFSVVSYSDIYFDPRHSYNYKPSIDLIKTFPLPLSILHITLHLINLHFINYFFLKNNSWSREKEPINIIQGFKSFLIEYYHPLLYWQGILTPGDLEQEVQGEPPLIRKGVRSFAFSIKKYDIAIHRHQEKKRFNNYPLLVIL